MKLTATGVRGIVIWDVDIHAWIVASELDNDLLHDQSIEFGTLFHGHNQALPKYDLKEYHLDALTIHWV